MTQVMLEDERKFALGEGVAVPDVATVLAGADVVVIREAPVELHATYYDSADLRLLASGVTLRRRRGGDDAGWHLKLPAGGPHERTEVRRPLGQDGEQGWPEPVPEELAELVFARLRGAALQPVAELSTRRSATRVRDHAGHLLVEVADDVVAATPSGCEEPMSWREVEIEQYPGGGAIADRIAAVLVAAGARLDESGPKLAHALGLRVDEGAGAPPAGGPEGARGRSPRGGAARRSGASLPAARPSADQAETGDAAAGAALRSPLVAAVLSRLAEQSEALAACDLAVRRHEDDSVHQMRVASRRLTSALGTFDGLFEGDRAQSLRDELRWLAHWLGAARDAEVMRAELEEEMSALPSEQLLAPVRSTLTDRLVGSEAVAGEELAAAMRSDRYAALLDELSAFVARPPLRAGVDLEAAARAAVRRDLRRVRRRMAEAEGRSGRARELALHEARKRAKQARYSLETVAPVYEKRAVGLARRYEALQEALGEHHDAVVIGELLREEGARAGVRGGGNGYSFGVLAGIQRCRAETSERLAWRAFARADRKKRRRFLRRPAARSRR